MNLLSPIQAAKTLGISTRHLRALTDNGILPFVDVSVGNRRAARYDPLDINAFVAKRKKRKCQSIKEQTKTIIPTTSGSEVVDIQALLAARKSGQQKGLKQKSNKKCERKINQKTNH